MSDWSQYRSLLFWGLIILSLVGVILRFYQITLNDFIYYDEGLYLNLNRDFVYLLYQNPPHSLGQFLERLDTSMKLGLGQGKPLWFFLSDLRAYLATPDTWSFPRVLSAAFGSLTLFVVYLFASTYSRSRWVGFLAAALLAVMPSHVYYSRLGMQEALSTFLFILGLYFYIFPARMNGRTVLAGVCFGLVFFTNYRMIITPVLIFVCEVFLVVTQWTQIKETHSTWKERLKEPVRRYIYTTLVFLAMVFLIGNIADGRNTVVTFSWMFHQKDLAQGHFDWFNLLSYPYYIFRLESVVFGLLFFGNIYYAAKKEWAKLLPFLLVCVSMAIFSLPQDKATRYLCMSMPLMAVASALVIQTLWQIQSRVWMKYSLIGLVIFMLAVQTGKSIQIAGFQTDHKQAVDDLKRTSASAKLLSTQNQIQNLFVSNRTDVFAAPHQYRSLIALYSRGYRYLAIDPQAYVSYTNDNKRFTFQLEPFYQFVLNNVQPLKTYAHMRPSLLERFVFEHNENFRQSLAFLKGNRNGQLGRLRVYDLSECLKILSRR